MRMIERWFPCAEVSEASASGWGSGAAEKRLFTWFAARPLAQAKAAVLTSLLPWPDDESEQQRLQDLVRRAMSARDGANAEVVAELAHCYPNRVRMLDPFAGRGMIPMEAGRYGVESYGIDNSPVAVLAGSLLTDYPVRDWAQEPELPWPSRGLKTDQLLNDVEAVLGEVGRRYDRTMADYYETTGGVAPFGYLWAVTLPCQECHRRFPLTGSLVLRRPNLRRNDAGQSYDIEVDPAGGAFRTVVHEGQPTGSPTLQAPMKAGKAVRGKAAICSFCGHVHPKDLHTRLAYERQGEDALLLVAEPHDELGRFFRAPTAYELDRANAASIALLEERDFAPRMPARPNEQIPENNGATIRPQLYGAVTYGDLCNDRQTLGLVRLARIIGDVGRELHGFGASDDYRRALLGYAGAVLVRKLKFSTRGARMRNTPGAGLIDHIFSNEGSIAFSYDYFESGLGVGPGTWPSFAADTLSVLNGQRNARKGKPVTISQGSARSLPFRPGTMTAVITDPPYDSMVYYTDSSDFFYVWLKRALGSDVFPEFTFTTDLRGLQERHEELLVKEHGIAPGEHRTREHYDNGIATAFRQSRALVAPDGVVTIVFGHGEPEVWHRLVGAIAKAGLLLTGSWPAKTEAGGQQGKANIVTTLTMACRPAPTDRPVGRANLIEAEVRREVQSRIPLWDAAGLAPTDQLMASAGPAMEAVGRYEQVLDHLGEPVDPAHYLVVARKAVIDATSVPIENLPLDTFDARTRFALGWARLYRRSVAPKSEARWQALAADLTMDELKGVLSEADKGVRLAPSKGWKGTVTETSSVIDVAMAMARAWASGLDEVAQVLAAAQRDEDDAYLWATLGYLSSLLPEGDPDAIAWTSLVRARRGIGNVTRGVLSAKREADEVKDRQRSLFDLDMAGETP